MERFVLAGPCGPPGEALTAFARRLAPQTRANTLGAAMLRLTMPGVPGVERGSEQTLIAVAGADDRPGPQPPVAQLAALAGEADGAGALPRHDLATEKLHLTAAALRLRRRRPEWFGARAGYEPLSAVGPGAAHCLAFVRSGHVVTVVTRLSRRLAAAGGWQDTRLPLPDGSWREVLTGRVVTGEAWLAELLADAPVALLVGHGA